MGVKTPAYIVRTHRGDAITLKSVTVFAAATRVRFMRAAPAVDGVHPSGASVPIPAIHPAASTFMAVSDCGRQADCLTKTVQTVIGGGGRDVRVNSTPQAPAE